MTFIREDDINEAKLDFASSGDNTVIAAVAGQVHRVRKLVLSLASATTVTFKSGSTELTGAMTSDGLVLDLDQLPWFTTAAGEALIISLGGAVQASGRIYYTTE